MLGGLLQQRKLGPRLTATGATIANCHGQTFADVFER